MGWMNRIARAAFNAVERRSSLENPQVPLSFPAEWLLDIFNGGRTDSGIRVSEMTALQVGTVYACVNIISGAFAALPLQVMEHIVKDNRVGKKKAPKHPLAFILNKEPNPEMTTFQFLKTLICHDLLWGNAYAEIQRSPMDASVVALWPRNPARTRAIRCIKPITLEGDLLPAGTLLYETTETLMACDPNMADQKDVSLGHRRLILAEDMVHVPGLSLDGRVGQGVVWLARQIIGLALATEKYAAKYFGNGARPAGILTIPSAMEDKAVENLRRSWAEAHGGENKWKVAVLEKGVDFKPIAATPDEGQMLQTRQYQDAAICNIFLVPMHMLATSNGKTGKSNVEQNSIEFVQNCLMPWITAWQMELHRKLFPKMGRTANQFFPHFDVRRLMYPDADSRAKFYASGRQWGYLTKNDIRELEDLNPDESGAGDIYTVQVNMQNDRALIEGGAADGKKPPVPRAPKPAPQQNPGMPGNQPAAGAPAPAAPAAKAPAKAAGKKGAAKPTAKGKRNLCPACTSGECLEHRDAAAPQLHVMRHGTTDANQQDVYRGWGDYSLDEQGKKDVAEAAEFLKDKGVKVIVTSSLKRHQETAQIVSAALGNIPITTNDDLKTLNVGVYTGKKRADYGPELEWYMEHPEEVIPGGESLDGFCERAARGLESLQSVNKKAGPALGITSRSNFAAWEGAGVTGGADVEVAEPGGIYAVKDNKLVLVFGDAIEDSLAGT